MQENRTKFDELLLEMYGQAIKPDLKKIKERISIVVCATTYVGMRGDNDMVKLNKILSRLEFTG